MSSKIRVILMKEDNAWIAQGLERDICVQAETLEDLYGRFDVAVRLEDKEPGGLDRIDPAPSYFFGLWDRKSSNVTPSNESYPMLDYGLAA